jgi:hypothetical protein
MKRKARKSGKGEPAAVPPNFSIERTHNGVSRLLASSPCVAPSRAAQSNVEAVEKLDSVVSP